jgi:hypothetical protein
MTTRDGLWEQISKWTKIEDAELVQQQVREFVLAVEEFEKKVRQEKEEKAKEKDLSTFVGESCLSTLLFPLSSLSLALSLSLSLSHSNPHM